MRLARHLLAAGLLAWSAAAAADPLPLAPHDPASPAGKILEGVTAGIDRAIEAEKLPAISVSRPVTAQQKGDVVSLTFPGVRVIAGADESIALGDIGLDVTPGPDGRYNFAVNMGESATAYEGKKQAGKLTFKKPHIVGIWSSAIEGVLSLDVRFADLKLVDKGSSAKLASLTGKIDGTLSGNRLDQTGRIELTGLEGKDDTGQIVKVGRIELTSTATGIDHAAWTRISRDADPEAAMLELLADAGFGAIATGIRLEDLSVREGKAELARLGSAHAVFGIKGDEPLASLRIQLGIERLSAGESLVPGELPPDLTPHSFALDATLDRLPLREAAAIYLASLSGDPKAADPDAKLQALADAAQPVLAVAQLGLTAEKVRMAMSGQAIAVPEAVNLATADFTLKVLGLDTLKAFLDGRAKKDPEMAQYVPLVVVLRGLATDSTLDGAPAKAFHIVADKTGAVTINGTPWEALLTAGEPKKGKQPTEQKKGRKGTSG